jgi:hypothetical protein
MVGDDMDGLALSPYWQGLEEANSGAQTDDTRP